VTNGPIPITIVLQLESQNVANLIGTVTCGAVGTTATTDMGNVAHTK